MPSVNNALSELPGWPTEYEIIYLDPLVCSVSKPPLVAVGGSAADKAAESLQRDFLNALQVRHEDAKDYWGTDGYGTRFQRNPKLQQRINEIFRSLPDALKEKRYFHSVSELLRHVPELLNSDRCAKNGCFVVVDAILATRVMAPHEIDQTLEHADVVTDESERDVTLLLADHPLPLLTLEDARIGVRADSQWQLTPRLNTILTTGWYPYARAVGMLSRMPAGHAYIDLLAPLVRPYPTLDTVLPVTSLTIGDNGHHSILEYVLHESLTPEIESFQPPTSEWKVYDRDKEFLEPLHRFHLCCQLNRVGSKSLRTRAPLSYQTLNAYLGELKRLRELLKQNEIASLILDQDTNIETFLAEPEERRDVANKLSRL
jgi:hypothetical protein